MPYLLHKKRRSQSQRVALSAFLFSGVLCVLVVSIFWAARHPSHYTYEPHSNDYITEDLVRRIMSE